MFLPGLSPARCSFVESMTLAQPARLLSCGGEPTRFTVLGMRQSLPKYGYKGIESDLMNRVDNPVNARVAADGFMLRVDKNNLEILVCRVLVNPVRVQYSQVRASSSNTLLGCGPK